MSIEARRWAHQQRCGTSSRQFVLHLFAEWADPWGFIRHIDLNYIAEHTLQSRSNVFRHISIFEEHGVLTRFATGKIDRKTTFSGQLHLSRAIALARHTKGNGAGEAEAEPDANYGEESQHATPQTGPESGRRVATCDCEESQHATPSLYAESESKESSPPTTETVSREGLGEEANGQEGPSEEAFEEALKEVFEQLIQNYPVHAAMDLEAARRELSRIPRWEWREVLEAARLLAAAMKQHRRLHPKDLATWLRQRGDRLINQVAAKGRPKPENQVFCIEGTRAWECWTRYRGGRTLPNQLRDGQGRSGWYVPSLFPPGFGPT